jgi:hypothetical protein
MVREPDATMQLVSRHSTDIEVPSF